MADDTRDAVAIRLDRVQILTDRTNTLWGLRLRNVEGTLALVRTEEELLVVFVENGDRDIWEAPLEKVHYLGDPPPPFGMKSLAGTAVRVDIDGDRRIIIFTGLPTGKAADAVADKQARDAWVRLLPPEAVA